MAARADKPDDIAALGSRMGAAADAWGLPRLKPANRVQRANVHHRHVRGQPQSSMFSGYQYIHIARCHDECRFSVEGFLPSVGALGDTGL